MEAGIVPDHNIFGYDYNNTNTSYSPHIHEALVYNYMRDWITALTFFTTLFIFSHFILRLFIRNSDGDNEPLMTLPITLCTICFSISLAAMLLMPITIVSNEVILNFPNHYYTQWLHRELIFALWNKIFWGANIALFLILPFSFFYYEAGGIGKGMLAKFYEAVIVLLLVAIIFGGFVYLVHKLLMSEVVSIDYLPFSYSLISASGAMLVLLSTPRGFTTITSYGLKLYLPAATRQILSEKLHALEIDEQVIQDKLKGKLPEAEADILKSRLENVRGEKGTLHLTTMHPLLRNTLFVMATLSNMAFAGYVVLRVSIHLLRHFFHPHAANNLSDFLASQDDDYASYSVGSFSSLLQVAVIIYMMTSAFLGFYNLPRVGRFKPQVGNTSTSMLILNMAFILLISSSFPIVARILEITNFDLLGEYNTTNYLRNNFFLYIYKVAFIVAFTHRYINFFHQSLYDTGVIQFLSKFTSKFVEVSNSSNNSSNNNTNKGGGKMHSPLKKE